MSKKISKVKQGLLLLCCLVAATGCKQAPPAQMETGYEVMTVSPTDRMISSTYSATIRGRQDIDIYPHICYILQILHQWSFSNDHSTLVIRLHDLING